MKKFWYCTVLSIFFLSAPVLVSAQVKPSLPSQKLAYSIFAQVLAPAAQVSGQDPQMLQGQDPQMLQWQDPQMIREQDPQMRPVNSGSLYMGQDPQMNHLK